MLRVPVQLLPVYIIDTQKRGKGPGTIPLTVSKVIAARACIEKYAHRTSAKSVVPYADPDFLFVMRRLSLFFL